MPSIPGVILIEGRIKTLKEFFKVDLLLMNVSSLFTLTELTARLEIPEDALTPIAPAGGSIPLQRHRPASDATGQFIVRGDTKGIHTVTAHFGGKITGSFLPEPVPFSGSASTDLEVKGPPKLDVKVTHPDHVVAGEPYDLVDHHHQHRRCARRALHVDGDRRRRRREPDRRDDRRRDRRPGRPHARRHPAAARPSSRPTR